MKKSLKFLLLILAIILGIMAFEEFILTKRYEFKISNYQIKIKSDECETCLMDWQINNYFTITDLKRDLSKKFEMYTEGPRLEIGMNNQKTELIINCPGFSTKIVKLADLSVTEELDISQFESKLSDFNIVIVIDNQKELTELEKPKTPSTIYE